MKEILQKLQRPLTRDDIDFRVGTIVTTGKAPNLKVFATVLAYKDARTDMKVLDEATDGMWQNEYRRDTKGVLQCGIGIKNGGEWVWKWSNGVETNIESEKGEYSDAFKRAGFMWGIGRPLYEIPTLFVQLREPEYYVGKDGKAKGTSKLRPNDWTWQISEDLKTFKASDKQGVRLSVSEAVEPETPKDEPKKTEKKKAEPVQVADWREFQITFGKKQGTKLGEMSPEDLSWWQNNYEPKPYRGEISKDNLALRAALDASMTETKKVEELPTISLDDDLGPLEHDEEEKSPERYDYYDDLKSE